MTISFDSRKNPATTIAGCFLALVVILGLFAVPTHAQCPEAYSVEVVFGLPKPPQFGGGYWPMKPQAINNNSEVVGWHNTLGGNIAFKWSPEKGMELLEMPPGTNQSWAYDISDNGIIVGEYANPDLNSGHRGFIINDNEFITIEPLPGGNKTVAQGINSQLQVVGKWGNTVTGPFPLAYLWENGMLTDLSPIFKTDTSDSRDINEKTAIVGWTGMSTTTDRLAFLYSDGIVTNLCPIPGGFTSDAGREPEWLRSRQRQPF